MTAREPAGGDAAGDGGAGRAVRGRTFEVFARRKRADRFEHVGTVAAPNEQLARVYAWQTYDEAKWFEMTVAPRDAFAAVNRRQAPFSLGTPAPAGEAG